MDTPTSGGDSRLVPSYTFEEFVVGPHNRFPHAASLAVSENLGKAYNPFFIYGPVGIGKTHLMQAVGHRVLQKNPAANVLYVTAPKFMSEVIEYLQGGKLQALRDRYRGLDLLLVDDIQFLSTSEATQEEFFHTFNDLHAAGRQIIMTSDRPPKMLTTLEDRLRSRFEWGLIADIKQTNLETRVAILKMKENRLGHLQISDDIRIYIASRLKSNVRELEGFLRRIQAYLQFNNQTEITIEVVKEILKELLPPEEWMETGGGADHPAVRAPSVQAAPPVPIEESSISVVPAPPPPPAPPAPSVDPSAGFASGLAEALNMGGGAPTPSVGGPPPPPPPPPSPPPGTPGTVTVAFFFPAGRESQVTDVRRRFDEIIKKHRLKFQLAVAFESAYAVDPNLEYEPFAAKCREKGVAIAIVIGPPSDGPLQESMFFHHLQEALDPHSVSVQVLPQEDISKDYRFLNIALDITLIQKAKPR
jgi:Holliday junction resolvasome RuvABC ATP-dependent DNA helicase subunit